MSIPFIAWFDGIEQNSRGEWLFDGLCIDKRGTQHLSMPVTDVIAHDAVRLDSWAAARAEGFFEKVSLSLIRGQKLLNGRALVRRLIPGLNLSSRHAIYRFDVGSEIYLVPAIFLINKLYLSSASAAPHLMEPGVLESYVDPAPEIAADSIRIRLPPNMIASRCRLDAAVLLAWLALVPEAQKCWSSIWFNACDNRIDLRLPDVSIMGRLGGYVVDGMRLVCWSREVTIDRGLPPAIVVVGKRGSRKIFQRTTEVGLERMAEGGSGLERG